MKILGLLAITVVTTLQFMTAPARADSVNLSTGLDASDTVILTGNTLDAHWTVDQPAGGIASAKVVAPGNVGGAFGPWAPNGPNSSWITIDPNSFGNGSVIPYSYYRTFNLTAADLLTASITGTWGIDDGGEVRLNGNLVSSSANDYSATTPFSVPTGSSFFVAGANTLTITMTNSDNFLEAVRLEASLNDVSAAAPIPATAVCGGALLGLLGVPRLMRRRV